MNKEITPAGQKNHKLFSTKKKRNPVFTIYCLVLFAEYDKTIRI
jgi:hypothetical protein